MSLIPTINIEHLSLPPYIMNNLGTIFYWVIILMIVTAVGATLWEKYGATIMRGY